MAKEEGITFVLKVRDDGTAVIEKASGSFGKLGTAAKKATVEVNPLTSSIRSLGKEMLAYAGAAFAVNQITNFAKATFEAGRSIQATQKAFVEITGSTKGMSNEFAFLQELADKTGQNFYDLTGVYKGFLAASKGTNLEGAQTQRVFQSIVKASATLGLTSENTRGALYAVQQMMSKGVVSSEELRQQLGERLPGAYNLLAEAMGVSVAQLQKMLAEGKVLSDEALPKLADVLEKRYSGVMASSTEAVNKLNESWERFKISISDSGFADIAVSGMNALSTAFKFWGERASLRSVSETYREGLQLAKQGLIDLDAFAKASFLERQRIVDSIFAHEQKLLAGRNIPKKAPSSTPIKSGPLPSSEVETALKKIVEDNRKAQVEIDSINSSAYQKEVIRIESEYQAKKKIVGSSVELGKWRTNQELLANQIRIKGDIEEEAAWSKVLYQMQEDEDKAWTQVGKDFREKVVDPMDKGEQEMYAAWVDYERNSVKETIESNKDKADAYRQMYDDIGKTTEESYNFKVDSLNKEYSKLKRVLGDSESLRAAQANRQKKLDQELILSSNNFFRGITVGYQRMLEDQKTWAQGGLAVFNSFATNSRSTLSNVLFDGIKGDLKSFENYWDSFFDSLLRTFTDTVAEMATQQVVNSAVSGLASIGGWAGNAALDWLGSSKGWSFGSMHSGSYYVGQDQTEGDKLKQDEFFAKLQRGEMVIPKDIADQARGGDFSGLMGFASGSAAGTAVGTVSAVAPSISESFNTGLKGIAQQQAMKGLTGYALGMSASQAIGMAAQGSIIGMVGLGFQAALDAAIESFAENTTGGLGAQWGGSIGSFGGGVFGGPGGAIAGGVVGRALGTALDALNEAFGMFGGGYGVGGWGSASGFGSFAASGSKAIGDMAGGWGNTYGGHMEAGIADAIGADSGYGGVSAGDGSMGIGGEGAPFRYGGVARGPESGYTARLHGTEVIVSQKRDIPVKVQESNNQSTFHFHIEIDGREIGYAVADQARSNVRLIKAIRGLNIN